MTNFTKLYADMILKKLMQEINSKQKQLWGARQRELELKQTAADVRTQKHWQTSAWVDLLIKEIETGYQRLHDLDEQTDWMLNVFNGQDRFKFVKEKYSHILKEYDEWVMTNN